jgi:hypothetical protein
MRNPADKLQIHTLARQLYPTNQSFLTEAFQDATTTQYSYLLLNLHSKETDENLRVVTNIFEGLANVYIPRKKNGKI